MNQAQFAKLHNVSRKTVSMWKARDWLVFAGDDIDVDASNAVLKKYRDTSSKNATRGKEKSVTQIMGNNSGNTLGNKTQGNKPKAAKNVIKAIIESAEKAEDFSTDDLYDGDDLEGVAERVLAATGAEWSVEEARRIKENYLALRNQLDYDREAGSVVAIEDADKVVAEEYAKVRSRLLAIPAAHAPRLFRTGSVQKLEKELQDLITDALTELTRDVTR